MSWHKNDILHATCSERPFENCCFTPSPRTTEARVAPSFLMQRNHTRRPHIATDPLAHLCTCTPTKTYLHAATFPCIPMHMLHIPLYHTTVSAKYTNLPLVATASAYNPCCRERVERRAEAHDADERGGQEEGPRHSRLGSPSRDPVSWDKTLQIKTRETSTLKKIVSIENL